MEFNDNILEALEYYIKEDGNADVMFLLGMVVPAINTYAVYPIEHTLKGVEVSRLNASGRLAIRGEEVAVAPFVGSISIDSFSAREGKVTLFPSLKGVGPIVIPEELLLMGSGNRTKCLAATRWNEPLDFLYHNYARMFHYPKELSETSNSFESKMEIFRLGIVGEPMVRVSVAELKDRDCNYELKRRYRVPYPNSYYVHDISINDVVGRLENVTDDGFVVGGKLFQWPQLVRAGSVRNYDGKVTIFEDEVRTIVKNVRMTC